MNLNLQGKNALIIAASQGLGKAIAQQLVKEGVNVIISSRNKEKLKKVQEELNQFGKGQINYFAADLKNKEDIRLLVQYTAATFGKIDILINNAGGPPGGDFEQLSDEDWQNTFELTFLSYVRVIREALPYMKTDGGRIINIASTSIKQPIPGLILSNVFRLGIVGLTKTLSIELAPHNILINTVAPGRIATDRTNHIDQMNADKQGISVKTVVNQSKKTIPLGRYGTSEEFAKAVTFLVSEACTYITGSSILIDGGMVTSI
ncbi:SDR family oxidoreductase [Priestia megaterium]|uniref:SDR family oxidoreductase n=1 Tax=Priestia megaterium TaxID=1404 RepID=UPI0025A42F1E|nr:SDR family oxidoreductase [Priestia megaterium]MDM8150097.1 SDR family oxidoreductase [Priestia megaterium]